MVIERRVLEEIVGHARRSLPSECCGILLAGRGDAGDVTRALEAENAEGKDPRRRYVLGHKAHLQAVSMEVAGTARIAGYYHSHPGGGTRPSSYDTAQAAAGVVYLIVGMGDGPVEFGAWRYRDGRLVPEPLEVHEPNHESPQS